MATVERRISPVGAVRYRARVRLRGARTEVPRNFVFQAVLDRIGFYTPIAAECAAVKQNRDWLFETEVFGIALSTATGTCPAGTQPLYRLYNNGQGGAPNHRYTTDLAVRSTMTGQGWIPEGNGALGVIGCAATPTRAPDNLLVLRVRAAMLNAPNPTVSVAIDGKTALAPTVVTATVELNSVQEIRLDTTSFGKRLAKSSWRPGSG